MGLKLMFPTCCARSLALRSSVRLCKRAFISNTAVKPSAPPTITAAMAMPTMAPVDRLVVNAFVQKERTVKNDCMLVSFTCCYTFVVQSESRLGQWAQTITDIVLVNLQIYVIATTYLGQRKRYAVAVFKFRRDGG
jgi:hypothetical protein